MAKSVYYDIKPKRTMKSKGHKRYTQKKDIDVRMAQYNIILGGRDTGTYNKNKEESIKAFKMWWHYRRMQKVSWVDQMFE